MTHERSSTTMMRVRRGTHELLREAATREERQSIQVLDRAVRLYVNDQQDLKDEALK